MRFEVDSGQVAQAAAAARVSGAAIHTEVNAMLRHLTELQASWRGGAAATFEGVLAQWRGTQVQVEAALDSISLALDAAARQYAEAEQAATRLFSH
jgi:WXG100 family type VII secretion target